MSGFAKYIDGLSKFYVLSFVTFFLFGAIFGQDVTIVYQKGTPIFEETAEATKSLVSSKAFIAVERDKEEEAKGALALEKDSLVCAIGSTAITTAFQAGFSSGVAVGLPNPLSKNYSTKKDFVFVSLYPEPKTVFEYLSRSLGAKTVGIIFTNSVNLEMAEFFRTQAESTGLKCKLMGVDGAQELTAPFPYFLSQVDVGLILIDPLSYSKDAVKFMVTKGLEKKKPIMGFSEQTVTAGVPIAFIVQARELSQATARAVKDKKANSVKSLVYYSGDFKLGLNEESVKAFGIKYEESRVGKKY